MRISAAITMGTTRKPSQYSGLIMYRSTGKYASTHR